MTKTTTKLTPVWVLTHKVTGMKYPTATFSSREAARKASKGKRFKGMYTPTKYKQVKQDIKLTFNTSNRTKLHKAPSITTSITRGWFN